MEKNKSKKAFYQHRTLIFMQIKIDEKLQKKKPIETDIGIKHK